MRLACLEVWALLAAPLACVYALDPEDDRGWFPGAENSRARALHGRESVLRLGKKVWERRPSAEKKENREWQRANKCKLRVAAMLYGV